MFLSILSGFLFSFPVALSLVCLCSAVGATMCYLLSHLVGRRIVRHFFPARADQWAQQVEKHKDELLSYVLFLRMTPFLPNWFINLVAPVIGVPLFPFAVGTFFGGFFAFGTTTIHIIHCCFFLVLTRRRTTFVPCHPGRQDVEHDVQLERGIFVDLNVAACGVCICHTHSCHF